MKKQNGIYLKVVFGVIGVVIVLFLVLGFLQSQQNGLHTETAVLYEVGDGMATSGFVVRDELVVRQSSELTTIRCKEGEWMSKGESIANTYGTKAAQERQIQLQTFQAELEQLEYAYNYATSNSDRGAIELQIEQQIIQSAKNVAIRNLDANQAVTTRLKSYILRRYTEEKDSNLLLQKITKLRNEIQSLQIGSTDDLNPIPAPASGYFSSYVDGLERVLSPDKLKNMTIADWERYATEKKSTSDYVGKMILSDEWYYITCIDSQRLDGHRVGDMVTVRFAYQLEDELRMSIERIGDSENGRSLLILKSDISVFDTTLNRQQSADVIFATYSGLRVPKKALYVDKDGDAGVYILEGASASWKNVEIIRENGDSYIVKLDKSSTYNLWPGDEIIVSDEELYNGKVVKS